MPTDNTNQYPASLLAHGNCCDAHVECDKAAAGSVHVVMEPAKRRENQDAAVRILLVRYAYYYAAP